MHEKAVSKGVNVLRILYLEDNPLDVDLVRRELERGDFEFELKNVETRDAFMQALQEFKPDVVLSDYCLPSFEAGEALAIAKRQYPNTPFILLSGTLGEERAIEILRSGITDYIVKDRLTRLCPAVHRALEEAADRSERVRFEEALRQSEERYTLAVEGARDGIWDWDLSTGELYLSPRWKEVLGYDSQEIGQTPDEWLSRVHPNDVDWLKEQLQAHIRGEATHFECEHRLRHRDGSYRWMLARGRAVRNGGKSAHRIAGSLTDVTDRKKVEEEMRRNAFFDRLTNLPNRGLFENRLEHEIRIAQRRQGHMFSVLVLDIDHFKEVNDSLGHAAGDELLHAFARTLEGCLRPRDTVARFGGDEFAILLVDIAHENRAVEVAARIHRSLSEPFCIDGRELQITASIGLVVSSPQHATSGDYLRSADHAMYRAKSLGRARCEIFNENMHIRSLEFLAMEKDFTHALSRSEFVIHYQPVVSLSSRQITGCEALVRWNHPTRGFLPPDEFIPFAEETGLIVPLGQWVLDTACTQLQKWARAGLPGLDLAVNLSARQFNYMNLADVVTGALDQSGLDPARLKLELTESMVMGYSEQTLETTRKLRDMGVGFSIDDFGTGYSSLTYLKQFPCNSLKIDRSFVRDITADPDDAAIATAIISLAHNLRMKVIAEGIETDPQREFLEAGGCDDGQGYLFSKPVAPGDFFDFVKSRAHMKQIGINAGI